MLRKAVYIKKGQGAQPSEATAVFLLIWYHKCRFLFYHLLNTIL